MTHPLGKYCRLNSNTNQKEIKTMELDITDFFNTECPSDYSASVAEIGQNAGPDTFFACLEASEGWDFIKGDEDTRQAIRDHFAAYGAWEVEEIETWSDIGMNALLIQDISAEMRDHLGDFGKDANDWNWQEYQDACDQGLVSGRLFGGPMSIDGRIYYYVGE
jgi:hypothetical protein